MESFKIKEITAFIRNNISNELTVEQVSKYFNYSFSHFSREFKKVMRVSASEYISALKIEQSIKILGEDTTVLKARLDSGFLSSGTFSNFFNRFTGLSPKQYQKEKDRLYTGLKNHEQKQEEGAINYLPFPQRKFSENKCIVHIIAPKEFRGMIEGVLPVNLPGLSVLKQNPPWSLKGLSGSGEIPALPQQGQKFPDVLFPEAYNGIVDNQAGYTHDLVLFPEFRKVVEVVGLRGDQGILRRHTLGGHHQIGT
jgi:AraC-like DNA-binding protein